MRFLFENIFVVDVDRVLAGNFVVVVFNKLHSETMYTIAAFSEECEMVFFFHWFWFCFGNRRLLVDGNTVVFSR